MSIELLPDSRAKNVTGRVFTMNGTWVPVFCANCGKDGGLCPEENMTFLFYLCVTCNETYGAIAGTMVMPRPAATRLRVETMRGASWLTCGLNPAALQAAIVELTKNGLTEPSWIYRPGDAPAWSNEARKGFLLNHVITEEFPSTPEGEHLSNSDPITGQAGWYDVRVRLRPCHDRDDCTSPRVDAVPKAPKISFEVVFIDSGPESVSVS